MNTVLIIGGGASGMAAAITAAEFPDNNIILLESQPRVGRKLLATGNGRCNLLNLNISPERYHGENADFVSSVFSAFGPDEILAFFRKYGLIMVSEYGGRIYPLSNNASSVVDVLRYALDRGNIELICGSRAASVKKNKKGFSVSTDTGEITADKVIVACGGPAGTALGAVSDGYKLLESLGHHKNRLYPSLVQIKTDPLYPKSLKGVRADAAVKIFAENRLISQSAGLGQSAGEVLFTDNGVSGPAIFDISRSVSTSGEDLYISLDFLREHTESEITGYLSERVSFYPSLAANCILTGALHNRLGQMICKYSGISGSAACGELTPAETKAVSRAAKDFRLKIQSASGFDSAQVTAGGMLTSEFYPETMESRIVPGLYACGEVLDIDGDCGGYNLAWAWASGHAAGFNSVAR